MSRTQQQPLTLEMPQPEQPALALAFAPLHKRALGIALGSAIGLLVFALTLLQLAVGTDGNPNLGLLAEYFYGYSVSVRGAFIGLLWGFFTGFVAGWFVAFTRNFIIAASIFITRTRAELQATRDFLDHV
jgi:hypothetical protein